MTKIKIDLRNGVLEVEGEETLVREMYADFKNSLAQVALLQQEAPKEPTTVTPPVQLDAPAGKRKPSGSGKSTRAKVTEVYKILGDLDLKPVGKKSLRDFIGEKNPSERGGETSTVMVYYLQKILGLENITLDHVYTCYKHAEKRVPISVRSDLKNIRDRKGWIDCNDMTKIRVTTAGENLVEHELPKKAAKASE